MTSTPRYAWLNGNVVPWDECVVHARSQGAFWGANVFEGVRAYWHSDQRQLSLFRLDDHLIRLGRSMKSLHMPARFDQDELREASMELLRANAYQEDVHVCVVAYFDMGPNFDPLGYTESTGVHITAVPISRPPTAALGATASISSWRRISDDSMPPRIKTGANYHNSRLAHHEAIRNGFNTTLLLNQRGTISEAPGACVVMVRDGKLITPPGTSGVLEGLTVGSLARIAGDALGIELERREIDRTELYVADEVFLCGTLAEILPIISLDRIAIGDGTPGVLTRKLQELYETTVRGNVAYREWITPVYPSEAH